MASWQCLLKVVNDPNSEYKIFCTGDQNGQSEKDYFEYFYTQMILPMSTFAVSEYMNYTYYMKGRQMYNLVINAMCIIQKKII